MDSSKRCFTPLYETVTENGVTKKMHYLTSATGLFAIFVGSANSGIMYYTLKDHQGSLTATIRGNTVRTKRYVGNCEYVTETEGNTVTEYWLTYLTGPTGVYAVVGSWTAITDNEGFVEKRLSYDAWGNLRNP